MVFITDFIFEKFFHVGLLAAYVWFIVTEHANDPGNAARHGPPYPGDNHGCIQVVVHVHVVSNGVVSFWIELEANTRVELVSISWCIWLGWSRWHGDANVVHVFGKWQYSVVSFGVLLTEGLLCACNWFPVGGAVPIAKGFASGYGEIVTNDEGLRTYDVGMVFGLAEGTCCVIFGCV